MSDSVPPELQTASGVVVLVMPNPHGDDPEHRENKLANLDFGPAGRHADDHDTTNITFREVDAGVGRAIVAADHPLIPDLFRKYPMIRIEGSDDKTTFLCHICTDGREFGSKLALRSHMRVHRDAPPTEE